jgi:hypothetical protein
LGIVPIIAHEHILGIDSVYTNPSLISDIAYLDRACANYLSNLDAIIQDQTFSQLTMPAQGVEIGSSEERKLAEIGTKRVFTYDGEAGVKPEYISPDPRQAQLIITTIKQIINEIYHSVGMAGERTKQDNSMGIDNSSGVAKAYDFDRVNALLKSKADSLKKLESGLAYLVARYMKFEFEEEKEPEDLVLYPETFDTRGLTDEFEIAMNFSLLEAPMLMRQKQMKMLATKVFPGISSEEKAKIEADIDAWEPISMQATQVSMDTALATAESQQGQNNSDNAK